LTRQNQYLRKFLAGCFATGIFSTARMLCHINSRLPPENRTAIRGTPHILWQGRTFVRSCQKIISYSPDAVVSKERSQRRESRTAASERQLERTYCYQRLKYGILILLAAFTCSTLPSQINVQMMMAMVTMTISERDNGIKWVFEGT